MRGSKCAYGTPEGDIPTHEEKPLRRNKSWMGIEKARSTRLNRTGALMLATTDPLRGPFFSDFAFSKLRFRLCLRLHGVACDAPSPMAG